jgi:phage replication O-like protein O
MAKKTNYAFTRMPNFFFDQVVPNIDSLSALKVTLAIIRKTTGWHQATKTITISELQALTGLSRQAVIDGVNSALENDLIDRSPIRKKNGRVSYAYSYKAGYISPNTNVQKEHRTGT